MSKERLRRISLNFVGPNHKPRWKFSGRPPHPDIEVFNEFNIHIAGCRFAITWEIWQ